MTYFIVGPGHPKKREQESTDLPDTDELLSVCGRDMLRETLLAGAQWPESPRQ